MEKTRISRRRTPARKKPKTFEAAPAGGGEELKRTSRRKASEKKKPHKKSEGVKAKRVTRRKTPTDLLETFMNVFNSALDDLGIPPVHHGRHAIVAGRYKVSVSAARKWVTGECLPDTDNLILIADDLKYSLDMLVGREPVSKKSNSLMIPVKKDLHGASTGMVLFNNAVIDSVLRSKHDKLEIHVVDTDSMTPTLHIDDLTIVDRSIERLDENKIYLFETMDGRAIIRRVSLGIGDVITLKADNRTYSQLEVNRMDVLIGEKRPDDEKVYQLRVVGLIPLAIKRVATKS